jgi:hypothetical protein
VSLGLRFVDVFTGVCMLFVLLREDLRLDGAGEGVLIAVETEEESAKETLDLFVFMVLVDTTEGVAVASFDSQSILSESS